MAFFFFKNNADNYYYCFFKIKKFTVYKRNDSSFLFKMIDRCVYMNEELLNFLNFLVYYKNVFEDKLFFFALSIFCYLINISVFIRDKIKLLFFLSHKTKIRVKKISS